MDTFCFRIKSKQVNKLFIISILLLSIHFYGCQSSEKQIGLSEEEIELKELLSNYYNIMSERDWQEYKSFFSEDATLTSIWQPPGKDEPDIHTNTITSFLTQTNDGPDSQPIFEEKMISADITVKSNLACAWVNYEAKFGSSDNLMKWKGMDLFSFIKHKGDWKITGLTFESVE